MLQRSPTYVVARPGHDARADFLRRYLPARLAHALIRWKNVLLGMYFYRLCKRRPAMVKAMILRGVRAALGPDFDVDTHFTPKYNPWDQRVCLVPDGDLFAAIRSGAASVVTGRIETFTGDGIRLETGETLPADLIVTATGLELLVLGGIALTVDGRAVDPGKTLSYKGMMLSGVPNLAVAIGKAPNALVARGLSESQKMAVTDLASRLGSAEWLGDEAQFDLVTALTGSGPGFVYRFIDALAGGAAELGMDRAQAERLAKQMVAGAAALAADSSHSPADLAWRVASPGGTTQKGLDVLDEGGALGDLLTRCLKATRDRERDLAQQLRA